MFSKICRLCLLVAIALLIWSGYCVIWSDDSRQDGGALVIENSEQDLGEQQVGSHTLELYVRNASHKPRRILGVTGH